MLKKWWSTSKLTENKNTFKSPLILIFFLSSVFFSQKSVSSTQNTQTLNGKTYYLGSIERAKEKFIVKIQEDDVTRISVVPLSSKNLDWLQRIYFGETYRVYYSKLQHNPKIITDVRLIGTIREVHFKDGKLIFGIIKHPLYPEGLWFFGKNLVLPRLMRRFPELYHSGLFPGREVLFRPIHKKEGPVYFFAEEIQATH